MVKNILKRARQLAKHARSDPKAIWLRQVMGITANVQPESGRIVYMPDPTSRIRFSSVFSQRRHGSHCANRPISDLDGLVRVLAERIWSGSKLVCRNHLARFRAGSRRQPALYHFPTFRLGSVLPQTFRTILCKTSPDSI